MNAQRIKTWQLAVIDMAGIAAIWGLPVVVFDVPIVIKLQHDWLTRVLFLAVIAGAVVVGAVHEYERGVSESKGTSDRETRMFRVLRFVAITEGIAAVTLLILLGVLIGF